MSKLVKMKMSDIKPTAYNPKRRVTQEISRLMQSMEEIGLQYPIIIDKKNVIIDGNRRYTAAKNLDWEEIQCFVSQADNPDKVYADLNGTAKGVYGTDSMEVWLMNPNAVSTKQATMFQNMVDMVGIKLFRQLVTRRLGPRTYKLARRLAGFIGWQEPEEVAKCVRWLITFGHSRVFEQAMLSGQIRADLLAACVENIKPVKLKFSLV